MGPTPAAGDVGPAGAGLEISFENDKPGPESVPVPFRALSIGVSGSGEEKEEYFG